MNVYRVITTEKPRCVYCGKELEEWTIGQTSGCHTKCAAEYISDSLIEEVKKQLSKINTNGKDNT